MKFWQNITNFFFFFVFCVIFCKSYFFLSFRCSFSFKLVTQNCWTLLVLVLLLLLMEGITTHPTGFSSNFFFLPSTYFNSSFPFPPNYLSPFSIINPATRTSPRILTFWLCFSDPCFSPNFYYLFFFLLLLN